MKKTLITILITLLFVNVCFSNGTVFATTKQSDSEKTQRLEYLNLNWWEKYNDPILTGYIQELYEKNYDLKIATLKVKEGEKVVRMFLANELPQISFDGTLGRTMRSSNQQFGALMIPSYAQWGYQLPLTASYEIDIWGQNRLKTKSAQKQLNIIKQSERAGYISLTSAFASTYFNLIKTDKLLELQNEIVKTQEEITSKVQKKYESGLCSINEVLDEQKLLTAQKEALNSLEHTQSVLENQLRVYLADSNKEIKRAGFDEISVLGGIPETFKTSVIDNRPDYIQSEENIKRIGYDVRIARKEFLPKFLIYGQLGFNAYQWGKMFNSYSQLANAGIMPSFDLFSGGRKMAALKLKKYEAEEAMANYQKTILTGIQEVNDSGAQLKTDVKNFKESTDRLAAENKKYNLMKHKNEIGAASNLDVLINKEQYLLTQRDNVSNKVNCIISTISLYKAAGGQDLTAIDRL